MPVYGFDKIPTKLDGIKTSVLVPNADMTTVEYIFSAYRESGCSLGDIVRMLNQQGVPSPAGTLWDGSKISRLLRSPVYVCADMEVYRYFKEKGARISNPAEDFTGERGCFLYGKRESNELKNKFAEIRGLRPAEKTQSTPKANKLKMQLETLNTQIDNLVDKIAETSAAIGKVLEEKLEKLIAEREGIRGELDRLGDTKQRRSYEEVIPLLDEFPEMPTEVKRQIAGEFIAKVLMWEDRLEIQWKF